MPATAVSTTNPAPAQANAANNNLVFINGRQQIVEMLKIMEPADKASLLANLRKRNPILAGELLEESINFSCLENLSHPEIQLIFSFTEASTWGMALQGLGASFQRKILSLASRHFAEQAFRIMTTTHARPSDIAKAQDKILAVIIELHKAKKIYL
jgi:flagellar motor switch protein FliG